MRIAIIGASGGIGRACIELLAENAQVKQIFALSRHQLNFANPKVTSLAFDFTQDSSLIAARDIMQNAGRFDVVLIATGLLQGQGIAPEKNMRAMSHEGFAQSFLVNTAGPALCAKYLLPLLKRDSKTVFAALSARVGSISDNRLGGWYAYRASKAALNMVIKTLAIEYGRRFKNAAIIGLHPGTVDTQLSKPFQNNVPEGKLFTPQQSAAFLLQVINSINAQQSGMVLDWDGKVVPA